MSTQSFEVKTPLLSWLCQYKSKLILKKQCSICAVLAARMKLKLYI